MIDMERKKPVDILLTLAALCVYGAFFLMFRLDFSKPVMILVISAISIVNIISDLRSGLSRRMKVFCVSLMVIALVVFIPLIIFVL